MLAVSLAFLDLWLLKWHLPLLCVVRCDGQRVEEVPNVHAYELL